MLLNFFHFYFKTAFLILVPLVNIPELIFKQSFPVKENKNKSCEDEK